MTAFTNNGIQQQTPVCPIYPHRTAHRAPAFGEKGAHYAAKKPLSTILSPLQTADHKR